MYSWITNNVTKAGLNLDVNAKFFSGDNGVGFNYNWSETNLLPFYRELVTGKYADLHLRVMIYNGDTD